MSFWDHLKKTKEDYSIRILEIQRSFEPRGGRAEARSSVFASGSSRRELTKPSSENPLLNESWYHDAEALCSPIDCKKRHRPGDLPVMPRNHGGTYSWQSRLRILTDRTLFSPSSPRFPF